MPVSLLVRIGALVVVVAAMTAVWMWPAAEAQNEAVVPAVEGEQLTLWTMIENGGLVLWVIFALSIGAGIMAVYFFMTITPAREVPNALYEETEKHVRRGNIEKAFETCENRDELLASVLRAGLRMAGHDRYIIQEAMESEGERGATALWQKISYLNNVGVIAPLLGLLGTVWGMMQAFGAIVLDDTQVRGLTMAYSVAQAMTTTAAGLVLAIAAMVVYFYLKGRVVKIVASVEAQASEFVDLLTQETS